MARYDVRFRSSCRCPVGTPEAVHVPGGPRRWGRCPHGHQYYADAEVRVGADWYSVGRPWRGARWPMGVLVRAVARTLVMAGLVADEPTGSGPSTGPPLCPGVMALEVGRADVDAARQWAADEWAAARERG